MNTVFLFQLSFLQMNAINTNFIKYIDQCNIVSFSLMLQYAFSQNPDWSQSPLYSFSWHTCSIDTRIHVFRNYRKETGKTKVFATVYSTVHEHTEKPVENISIVSSEALLSVLNYVCTALLKSDPSSSPEPKHNEMRWDEMRGDGLQTAHENGLLWLDPAVWGNSPLVQTQGQWQNAWEHLIAPLLKWELYSRLHAFKLDGWWKKRFDETPNQSNQGNDEQLFLLFFWYAG